MKNFWKRVRAFFVKTPVVPKGAKIDTEKWRTLPGGIVYVNLLGNDSRRQAEASLARRKDGPHSCGYLTNIIREA